MVRKKTLPSGIRLYHGMTPDNVQAFKLQNAQEILGQLIDSSQKNKMLIGAILCISVMTFQFHLRILIKMGILALSSNWKQLKTLSIYALVMKSLHQVSAVLLFQRI